jgi:hypothetical protein
MKIEFEDKSYIECTNAEHPGKIIITISARDHQNNLKKITNAVELTMEQFKQLFSDVK